MKKLLTLAVLAGVAAVVAKKVASSRAKPVWQAPPPGPTSPYVRPQRPADDAGGASPDEAVADHSAKPTAPTTPDHPATVTEVKDA